MKLLPIFFLLSLVHTLYAAEIDNKTQVQNAITLLDNKPNYSWTSIVKSEVSNFQPGPTEGKVQKNGYTYFALTAGTNTIEAAFSGVRSAIKMEGEWESAEELKGDREWIAQRLKNFQPPSTEAGNLLAKTKDLKAEKGNAFFSSLTEEGVKEILSLRTRGGEAKEPKGWVRFWINTDGTLIKYEFNLRGKVTSGQEQSEVALNFTTTVDIKRVGTTQTDLIEAAKKKLS
jgi:hypothetical protein